MTELKEKKPRKASPTQQLADWFWLSVLQREPTDRYINPDFRRLLHESKDMLTTMKMDAEIIKRAVLLMETQSEKPKWLSWVYHSIEPTTQKTWYEASKSPLLFAPPLYERLNCLTFLKRFDPNNPLRAELEQEFANA